MSLFTTWGHSTDASPRPTRLAGIEADLIDAVDGHSATFGAGVVGPYDDLAARLDRIEGTDWTTFTPTFTGSSSNPNVGSTGTKTGAYSVDNHGWDVQVTIVFAGSGISVGSGDWYVGPPPGFSPGEFDIHNLVGMAACVDSSESGGLGMLAHRFGIVGWLDSASAFVVAFDAFSRKHTGRAVVAAGSSSIVVAHGLGVAPQNGNIQATPSASPATAGASNFTPVWVDENATTTSNLTIHATRDDGSNIAGLGLPVNWSAEVTASSGYLGSDRPFPWASGDTLRLWYRARRISA